MSKTRLSLKQLVAQFKGLTPDQIYLLVKERGIKARTGTTRKCPLAILMNGVNTGQHVIGRSFVVCQHGNDIEKVSTPRNLQAFIRIFDTGGYPDLMAPAPRCLPQPPKGVRSNDVRSGDRHKIKPSTRRWVNRLAKMVERFPEAAK